MKAIIITIVALSASIATISAQNNNRNIDLLQKVLQEAKSDTEKIKAIIAISKEYSIAGDNKKSIEYVQSALSKSQSIGYTKGVITSYGRLGIAYTIMTNYNEAIKYYLMAIDLCKQTGEKKNLVKIYNNLGIAYGRKGDYENQIMTYMSCLKVSEEINDTLSTAIIYENIGNVYMRGGSNDKALDYFNKALKTYSILNDMGGQGSVYSSIAAVYKNKGRYSEALKIANKSLEINRSIDDQWQLSTSLHTLADIYFNMEDYDAALKNHFEAIKICNQIGDDGGASSSYTGIGNIYLKRLELIQSEKYLSLAINLSEKTGDRTSLMESFRLMSELFDKKHDCLKSYDYYKKYSALKDSINTYETSIKIEGLQSKYESDKREKILELEKENQEAKYEKERTIRYSFMTGFVLILAIAFFIFKGYRDKVKSSKIIYEQKKLVEEKNKEITDNINYAKRIQDAIMPPLSRILELLPNSFIFNRGRDIVSGDFYFVEKISDNEIIFAVADSTSHGVSGSMMSMLNSNLLTEAVQNKIYAPSKILDHVNTALARALHQTGVNKEIKDGMDISLCKINIETMALEFSGAYNSLIIIRDRQVMELDADKLQLGQAERNYTNHTFQLQKDDMIFLSSDGFSDQFGGEKNKKYKYKNFLSLLSKISSIPITDQYIAITTEFDEWRGNNEQTDDVLVFGIRV